VGPRASLNDVEERQFFRLPGLELRPLGRPARSLLLYRLRYLENMKGRYDLERPRHRKGNLVKFILREVWLEHFRYLWTIVKILKCYA
jgi:hypothetical protein